MFYLTYGIDTVELRNPDSANQRTIDTGKIVRRTLSNSLLIGRPAAWFNNETINVTFSVLTQSKLDELITFLKLYNGLLIEITDHNDLTYTAHVFITELTSTTLRDSCSYSISLTLIKITVDEDKYWLLANETEYLITHDDENILIK